jgi:hypothetical protein
MYFRSSGTFVTMRTVLKMGNLKRNLSKLRSA